MLQVRVLKAISKQGSGHLDGSAYAGKSKLRALLGDRLVDSLRDRTLIDFGRGTGHEAIEIARCGAKRVIGIDIRESVLAEARRNAAAAGIPEGVCEFVLRTDEKADAIVSLDSFEHFADPAGILRIMASLLRPDGHVAVSFGPPWYHPYGGHLFSVFPWAHVLFSEDALCEWRRGFKTDGARRFEEVEGGLNQMTVKRFEETVRASPFRIGWIECVPLRQIRRAPWLHNQFTREFTTAVVRCDLSLR
jgi:SAM-dependent methyltransferase